MKFFHYILLALLASLWSCGDSHDEHAGEHSHEHATLKASPEILAEHKAWQGVEEGNWETLPVTEIDGKVLDFETFTRKDNMTQYQCSQCHDNNALKLDGKTSEVRTMHVDIHLNHSQSAPLDCFSCHNEKNMDTLKLHTGQEVDFDRPYQLCSQCHSQQYTDWKGGAHGKRKSYWKGQRTIYNCTDCHNPHDPLFPHKVPVGRPTIPRTKLLK